MAGNQLELTIIIPAYNEKKRLESSLKRIISYCRSKPRSFEIIVADDGSGDGTGQLAREIDPSIRVLDLPHRGKGGAIKAGFLASRGQWILLCDVDLSTPIEWLEQLWSLRHQYDLIIGSRALPESVIRRPQNRLKVFFGQMGNLAIQRLAVPGIEDTQCGFKLCRQRCRFLFEKQRVMGWGFDIEILYLARKYGFKVIEVPVEWTNDPGSKVKWGDYLKTFLELLTVRLNDLRGHYR